MDFENLKYSNNDNKSINIKHEQKRYIKNLIQTY